MNEAPEFLLTLLHASTNTHLLHWTSKSYAEHQALGAFYTGLPELVDQVAEAMMGKFDMTPTFPVDYYAPAETAKEELEDLKEYVMDVRTRLPQDSEIQNLIDEIAQSIDQTLYLLRFP
jgi:DNA-binding ferritin-like protein